jgi:sigma-B regulation protein RsbU (phosphoserine phosphatase)
MKPRRNIADDRDAIESRSSGRSIRSVLLVAVNLPLVALVGMFLVYDYQREMIERMENKRIALEEEAKTLLPAALELRQRGTSILQRYIDTVCAEMRTTDSPGHHIAVRLPDITLQAAPHQRASPEMLTALKRAAESPNHRATWKDTELIVGVAEGDEMIVYVAETMKNVRMAVRAGVFRRLTALVIMFLIAALIVNLVLLRIVTNPIQMLVATVQQIANGRLGAQSEPFRSAEFDYLAGEINRMSRSLAAADRDRRSQMAKAWEIQQHLLPQPAEIPGLDTAFLFQPAEDVAGDYYDIVRAPDGAYLFCIADVTGHGVPAAMSAAMLKMLLWQASEHFSSPAKVLSFINDRFLLASLASDFVSMLVVRALPHAKSLEYASAGHEPAWLLLSNGTLQKLPSTGLLLGIEKHTGWDTETIEIVNGSRLFMISDGATEALNPRSECFGRQRFAELCAKYAGLSVRDSLERINETLTTHRNGATQGDDITIVLVEFDLNDLATADKSSLREGDGNES